MNRQQKGGKREEDGTRGVRASMPCRPVDVSGVVLQETTEGVRDEEGRARDREAEEGGM